MSDNISFDRRQILQGVLAPLYRRRLLFFVTLSALILSACISSPVSVAQPAEARVIPPTEMPTLLPPALTSTSLPAAPTQLPTGTPPLPTPTQLPTSTPLPPTPTPLPTSTPLSPT